MYEPIKISEFLHRKKEQVVLNPDEEYSLVTVRLHHKGVVLRQKKKGGLIRSKMYRISKGQFILSGIDARNGAFGIVPDELDGAIITNDFWCFDVDETKVKRDFFYWLTNTPTFLDACIKSSRGETQRIRLQKKLFLNFEFHFPPIEKQEEFLREIKNYDDSLSELNAEQKNQSSLLQNLREQILQEAIEGKLTAAWRKQNPALISGENHAVKLLEKIQAEKGQSNGKGVVHKGKTIPPITEAEKPFSLPDGWTWCHLGEISKFIDYRGKTPTKIESGIRLITAKNVRMGMFSLSPEEFISETEYKHRMTRGFPKKGDIFFTTEAPLGNVCQNPLKEEISVGQRIITIQAILLKAKFLMYELMARPIQREITNRKSGITAKGIKSSRLALVPIAIPPLYEQEEIVNRIDMLTKKVQNLEKQITERQNQSELLMKAVLGEAFSAKESDVAKS